MSITKEYYIFVSPTEVHIQNQYTYHVNPGCRTCYHAVSDLIAAQQDFLPAPAEDISPKVNRLIANGLTTDEKERFTDYLTKLLNTSWCTITAKGGLHIDMDRHLSTLHYHFVVSQDDPHLTSGIHALSHAIHCIRNAPLEGENHAAHCTQTTTLSSI